MGREATVTYGQVAAAADAMCSANIRPSSRTVRERLGNTGSMGTINRAGDVAGSNRANGGRNGQRQAGGDWRA
ncbi:DNA-binding protein [Massilia psychrophila]|uniref:KfrA N-terminal DNA-binding domain-containing protein n=1 Tax=Massilia psychrophila TaxID=1603353 RepID=A0A2G8SYT8_9BURK|nr:DNA-binding protein [Massilia psychrophila]PIL38965.1 hypothetical protein CR103_14880 [Massilia psychrophila]GGE88726.1 hypothetical protein GCM10008020_37230 [Massilia psychrophila]